MAATTYHQLGRIAQERRDFDEAERWYRKSLAIDEKQGNEHGAALTYGQLGILAGLQEDYLASGEWLLKALFILQKYNDQHRAQRQADNFFVFVQRAPEEQKEQLLAMWTDAGLPLPEDTPDDGVG